MLRHWINMNKTISQKAVESSAKKLTHLTHCSHLCNLTHLSLPGWCCSFHWQGKKKLPLTIEKKLPKSHQTLVHFEFSPQPTRQVDHWQEFGKNLRRCLKQMNNFLISRNKLNNSLIFTNQILQFLNFKTNVATS